MESSAISLIMVGGPREGETLDFPPGTTIRIGRIVRGNSIAIKDAGISTKHLSINFDSASGSWMLQDLDSSNGTFVNGTKLPPHDAFALSDGDAVKFGEWTSILVRMKSNQESRSRRNPKQKAAEKCTGLDVVGSVAGTRGRRGKAVEEVSVNGGGNDAVLESGRCLRPRKGRGVKVEITNQVPDCKKIGDNLDVVGRGSENLSNLETEPSPKITTRRTRRTKNTVSVATDSVLGNVPENSCVDGEVKAETKKTRGGTRGRKKKLEPEISENVEQKINTMVDDGEDKENVNVEEIGIGSNPLEAAKAEKGPDLEKMTLGEWFDYLETHLPKQIIDETEEIIYSMRIKAAQVRDYVAEQRIKTNCGEG